jgi:hypothetical protein
MMERDAMDFVREAAEAEDEDEGCTCVSQCEGCTAQSEADSDCFISAHRIFMMQA